jgi:hypothetical protein
MKRESNTLIFQSNVFIWIAVATGALLLIPLIAMQFTSEVNWKLADFIAMGALLFGMAGLFVLVARRLQRRHRLLAGVVFVAAFVYIWAELAVGVFTTFGS